MNLVKNWSRISLFDRVFYFAEGTVISNQSDCLTFTNPTATDVVWCDGILYSGTVTFLKGNACVQEDFCHTEVEAPDMVVNLLKQYQPTLHHRVTDYLTLHPERLDDVPAADAHATWVLVSNLFDEHDAGELYPGELKGELTRTLGKKLAEEITGLYSGTIITV